MEKQSFIKNPT